MRGYRYRLLGAVLALAMLAMVSCSRGDGTASEPTDAAAGGTGLSALVGKAAPDFSLVDQFDRRQHLARYRGKVVLLTFVSSHCTDICPLTAELLSRTQDLLGDRARALQLVAVNANSVYRSVASVARWSEQRNMTHRWLFLTGSLHQLFSVYSDYGVAPGASHTIAIFLIDRQGRVRAVIPVAMQKGIDAEARALERAVGKLELS